jgi:SAM-dependent methyltransferase
VNCPCCAGATAESAAQPLPHWRCPGCGHRWRETDPAQLERYYHELQERNPKGDARKLDERVQALRPHLREGMRVLEIGCAEGALGARLKSCARLHYTGIEPSRDARAAAAVLDLVVEGPARMLHDGLYDLVIAFHVLEHIVDPAAELGEWRRLLHPAGVAMVEVPNRAGHPLVTYDRNPEHVHQFTAASLAALAQRCGFEPRALGNGHFESPLYADSLRLLAQPAIDDPERRARLLDRLRARLDGPFAVYGLGGDFRNYLAPLLAELPVAALLDSDPDRLGERVGALRVEGYDATRHGALPIVVASVRHHDAIVAQLAARGVASDRIIGLADLYGPP